MSTLATSRQPTLNLILKRTSRQEEQEEQETETEAHRAVVAMHPDCLPMPLPLAASGSHSGNSPQLQQQPEDDGDEDAEGSACDEQHLVNVLDEPNDDDDMEDDDLEEEELELDDAASCCSENSVLSVGQEQSQVAAAAHATRQRLLMSQLYRPSAFSSVSHSMQQQHASALSLHQHHVQVNEDAAIIMAHTPASFQEEFLRKSQLYAEELMKQQMQLMAAARVNALTAAVMPLGGLRGPKMMTTQQLQMAAAAAAAAAMRPTTTTTTTATAATATTTGQDALAQLTATALGIGSAAGNQHQLLMQQQQQQQQQNLSHAFQQQSQHNNNNNNNNNYNNNNFNNNINNLRAEERALKFSIDNILKADFGNRLQQRLAASGAAAAAAAAVGVAPPKAPRKTVKPLNLAQTQPSLSFSSSLANICSNSNDSNSTATSSSTANNNNPPTSAIDLVKSPNANANATSPAPGSKSGEDAATGTATGTGTGTGSSSTPIVWPAWVYCTRYSDRPSSGRSPRTRKPKKPTASSAAGSGDKSDADGNSGCNNVPEDKRPRTAFSGTQLARLKHEFNENRYLTEKRRQQLSGELGLNEAQIKIWFQNKRAKLKKSSGTKNPLALQLMAQGLYNHSTVPLTREEEELQELQEAAAASASASASAEPS